MELIEAHRGRGQCVVAVISAVKGETDRLLRSVEGETVEVKAECLSGGGVGGGGGGPGGGPPRAPRLCKGRAW